MFHDIYKMQLENLKLQRELSQAQRDLVRELAKPRECYPCPCAELEPAVLFKVTQRSNSYKYEPAWRLLGFTNDLSIALAYKDGPRGAWINVERGFIDKNGRLYDARQRRVEAVPAEYRP